MQLTDCKGTIPVRPGYSKLVVRSHLPRKQDAANQDDAMDSQRALAVALEALDGAATSDEMLKEAVALQQRGEIARAVAMAETILVRNPTHVDTINFAAILACQDGQLNPAIQLLNRAVELDPLHAVLHGNRGFVLKKLGSAAEALASYDRCVELLPDYVEGQLNRAHLLNEMGRWADAMQGYDRVIELRPELAVAHYGRANALTQLTRYEEALASYDRAAEHGARHPENSNNRGLALECLGRFAEAVASYDTAITLKSDYAEAYGNRGNALRSLGQLDEALASYNRALELQPGVAEFHHNRAAALQRMQRFEEAVAAYNRALVIKPDMAKSLLNRGATLQLLQRFDDALQSYDRALLASPRLAEAHFKRGTVYHFRRQFLEAVACYDQALALDPEILMARLNRGLAYLAAGDFQRGWPDHESRHRHEGFNVFKNRPSFSQPRWEGATSIDGKTLLVLCEQGLGDTLQFCRYLPLLAERGARVIFEVHQPLRSLLSTLPGVAEVITRADPLPDFDAYSLLLSLPMAFGTSLSTIPGGAPYVKADPDKSRTWKERLGPARGLRVGLVWSGVQRLMDGVTPRRNIPLREFALLRRPKMEFYSLQKGEAAEAELAAFRIDDHSNLPPILEVGSDLNDFSDTAALVDNLDLVISVDTSCAHLAGAMGKPVWILNRFDACWRWLKDRDDSPWYPTATLYRQEKVGDWASVIERVRADLGRWA